MSTSTASLIWTHGNLAYLTQQNHKACHSKQARQSGFLKPVFGVLVACSITACTTAGIDTAGLTPDPLPPAPENSEISSLTPLSDTTSDTSAEQTALVETSIPGNSQEQFPNINEEPVGAAPTLTPAEEAAIRAETETTAAAQATVTPEEAESYKARLRRLLLLAQRHASDTQKQIENQ